MKKFFSLFAALTLSVGLWAEMVSYRCPEYIDGDVTKGIYDWISKGGDATPITSSSSTWGDGGTTWLVVNSDVTISERITCDGEVHLILADGAKLNATQGITVSGEGNSLTIYAQTEDIAQMGQLIATGESWAAGIGGGDSGDGSNITINGGNVTANGNQGGAGIGGGDSGDGSNITINGGNVTANGNQGGAGIGGGSGGSGSNITINGGEVTAKGDNAAGIGGGGYGDGSNITINGGEVTANGGEEAAGIGGGAWGAGSNIFVATSLVIKAGDSPNPTTVITNTGADLASSLAGKRYATIEPAPTPVSTTYLDENGEEQNIDAFEVKDASEAVTWGTAGQTTWFVVNGTNVQLAKGAICAGDVRLILADGAKLTATGDDYEDTPGINVTGTNSLTIYGYTNQSGQLIAKGGYGAAGIGGGMGESGSNITINGGEVMANGGEGAAGIGGGNFGSGSNITINGGKVTATGIRGAGIGGGVYESGSNITINSGTVTANGGEGAAGIGGGDSGYSSNITINGGTVTANGGIGGTGIGGGVYGSGSNITINGGTVTANGGENAAGIGNGWEPYYAVSDNIYISDAYVLKAGAAADPTEVIAHSSAQDLGETLTQQYVKIEGLATPYTRTVGANKWATVCLPYDATGFSGADFYKVNYYDASDPSDLKLYIEPVDNLVAGMPYIFETTADVVTIEHAGVATLTYGEEQNFLGLYGSFARKIIESDGSQAAISGGSVVVAEEYSTITIPACRAYLNMDEVPTVEQPHNAPLRCMGAPRGQATDLETMHDAQCTMHNGKFLRNGQFIIVREGKMFNAQGMEVK